MSALTRCLVEEAAAIAACAGRLDAGQLEGALALLDACADSRAKLVITGVGKSGIIARKIAATFSSIGLMVIYLNPLDALHGDLGVVAAEDVALLLSNSGETEERNGCCVPRQCGGTCRARAGGSGMTELRHHRALDGSDLFTTWACGS